MMSVKKKFGLVSIRLVLSYELHHLEMVYACLETFFGLGLIVGPTVGGALYQAGGYTLPFAVTGCALFTCAIFTAIVLPKHDEGRDRTVKPSVFKLIKIPGVLLASTSVVTTSIALGFIHATLEPHLRQFNLTPIMLGSMFVIEGGVYAVSAPVFGWICDKLLPPKVVIILGTLFVGGSFILLGPAPFLMVDTQLWMCILALVLQGIGTGAHLVSSFSDALRTSVENGFPNNIETFGLISGLWTSSFAFGAFIGPSVSGILFDYTGFRNATMFVVAVQLIFGLVVTIFLIRSKPNTTYVELKEDDVLPKVATSSRSLSCSKSQTINIDSEVNKSVRSVGGISIERSRPPGMNSVIACSSYKSQAWPDVDKQMDRYSRSTYGALGISFSNSGVSSTQKF